MAKQLYVNLAMTADTSKAKRELQALQKQLDSLMTSANKQDTSLGLSAEIQKATQLAAQLKVQLQSATTSTGTLDLSKFNQSLQKSNTQLEHYRIALQSLGSDGTKAFASLASSIMQAEVPLRRTNARLAEFATTLKNTARWQISSSILHGFMGALQGAYGYAQDLNESLNNIRIVTGQSVDQMAKFAETANRAAKELSTTTTAYTDAALIYYQQGLNDDEVKKRTDVTIKMANVSRQSAEEVSSQMTAIWNNFDDGSKSLEYYADVITKLGASTASSSEEIAQGLEKFAAVADTVGLSYEKATAALATVVAETRQSADVVGTAFRTMFARFQGLQLGETLEDGVDLNKYSKALAAVGVNILEVNGSLKDMDTILDELGAKWNMIGEEQKVALAETVAGTRQYAQLMALMNNYDKVLVNQNIASGSEGTLQKQADIYADSWEAASKRVKAAAQGIYQDLLDDKAFIKMLNWLEKTISFFDKLIENAGGLKGVLLNLGTVLMTAFGPQIQASMQRMVDNIKMMSPAGRNAAQSLRQQAVDQVSEMAKKSANGTNEGNAMAAMYEGQAQLQQTLIDKAALLTEEEKKRAQILLDINQSLGEQAIATGKIADNQARELSNLGRRQLYVAQNRGGSKENISAAQQKIQIITKDIETIRSASSQLNGVMKSVNSSFNAGDQITKKVLDNIKNIAQTKLNDLKSEGIDSTDAFNRLQEVVEACSQDFEKLSQEELNKLSNEIDNLISETGELADKEGDLGRSISEGGEAFNELANAYGRTEDNEKQVNAETREYIQLAEQSAQSNQTAADSQQALQNGIENTSKSLQEMGVSAQSMVGKIQTFSTTIMQVASAINALKSIGDIWSDEDATMGEKILQTMMSMSMVIPLVTNILQTDTVQKGIATAASKLHAGAMGIEAAAAWALTHPIIVLTALLVALVAVIALVANARKKEREETEKAAKESQEKVKTTKEEIDSNNKLIKSYEEILKAQDGSTESKIELRKAALDVANALEIENGALLVQQENYEALTKAIKANQIAKNKELRAENNKAIKDTEKLFSSDIKSKNQIFSSSTALSELEQLVNSGDYDIIGSGTGYVTTVYFNTKKDDIESQIKAYEEISDLIKRIDSYDEQHNTALSQSGIYKDMISWLQQAEESYTKINELKQQGIEIDLSDEVLRRDTITTQEQYDKLLEDSIVKISKQWNLDEKGAKEAAEAYFALNNELSQFVINHKALEDLQKTTGISIDTLQEYFNEYGEILFKVSPDLFKSKSALEAAIAVLQSEADQEEVKVKISTYREAQKKWKEGMSSDEIEGFFSDYGTIFTDEQSKLDFLNQSNKGQQDFFFKQQAAAIKENYNTENLNKYKEALSTAKNEIEALQKAAVDEQNSLQQQYLNLAGTQAGEEINRKINELSVQVNNYQDQIDEYQDKLDYSSEYFDTLGDADRRNLISEWLGSASNLQDLDSALKDIASTGIDITFDEMATALISIGQQYDSCSKEVSDFEKALMSSSDTLIASAEAALRNSINIAEMSKALGLNADAVEEQARELEDAGDAAKTVAVLNQSMNKGLSDLSKNWKDWKKNLDAAKKGTQDYADAAVELKTTLAQLLGITNKDFIPDNFLELPGVMDNIEAAASGDVKAINQLGISFAQATVESMEFAEGMQGISSATGNAFDMTAQGFDYFKNQVLEGITNLNQALAEGTLQAGENITDLMDGTSGSWITALNEMAYATSMSVEEMNSFLNELGVQADITTTTKEITSRVPVYRTVQEVKNGDYMSGNFEVETKTNIVRYEDMPGEIEVAQINMGDDAGTPPTVHYAGRANASPSSLNSGGSGGGGGSSSKHSAETHVDEEHRYDSLNKELDGLSKQYQRLEKAKDRAYGGNKLAIMEKEIALLKRMQATYEKYLKTIAGDNWKELHDTLQNGGNVGALISSGKAGGNLQRDFNKLTRAVEKAIEYIKKDKDGNETLQQVDWKGLRETIGVDIMLDEFGNIANKDEIEEAIEAWWNHAYVDWWNNLSASDQELEVNKEQKDILSAIKSYMEQLLEQYEQSIEDFTEYSDSYMDNLYELQSKVYEEFRYKLDLKVEISERSLKRLEYAIKVLGDNIYKIPEVMRSWFDKRVNQTLAEVQNLGNTWISGFQEASALHSSGQISDEDYAQLIKDAQDGLYECIDKLLEINEEMREYYKNVLSHVQEEMAHITDEMDHQLNTLTHLTNVLSLLGRETDYDAIQVILNGQMQMTRNAYEVSKAQTEMYRRQVEEAEATLRSLTGAVSREALEEWKNAVLYPAQEALRAAEEEMQQDFEAYLEVLNAIYENRINKIYQESERRLAGAWGNFDEVNRALERQRALDEEYLTKTNQIYETNVLLRKIAQDIDKVNNQSAKLQLKNFADEIEALQQKNKLNKTDLEIAKARYAILQAQIALEDAQNAKSTVRLQRDNEGNFGYVYTADETKIAEAEENLEKANNDLYNLVLEQANSYTEKIIQITQERNAALQQLDMDYKEGRIKDEETYNRLRQDIVDKYNGLLEASYYSYYTAIGWLDEVATTDHTEAWCTSFEDILDAGSDFQAETDRLMEETGAMIDWLNAVRAEATEEAKVGAGELEQQVQSLTAANNDLANQMIHDVVPAMEEVLRTAQELTEEWVRQYDAIMALIDSYLQMIDAMNEALANMASAEPADLSEGLGYDPNFDYANAMRNYLAAGGSREDEQYKQWQIERELKINGMGLTEDYYGYRGQELENAIDLYLEKGLTEYGIKDALEKYAEQSGENLEALLGNTGATQDNTGAIQDNSGALKTVEDAAKQEASATEQNTEGVRLALTDWKYAKANFQQEEEASQEKNRTLTEAMLEKTTNKVDETANKTTEEIDRVILEGTKNFDQTSKDTTQKVEQLSNNATEKVQTAADKAAEGAREGGQLALQAGGEMSSAVSSAAGTIAAAAGTIAAAANTGCFEAGTKVIMENNAQKDIETIQIGEKVLAYNEQEKIFNLQVVLDVYIHYGTQVTVNIELSNGVILHMTPGHPILTTDGWKSLDIINSKLEHGVDATLLELDDVVLGYDSVGVVQNITWNYYPEGITVYTLKVAEYHTFIADNMIVHNAKVAMFDSGGYTGSWGSSGKLAMLHEKELVLDANDTQNLLAAVNVIRELNSAIDLRAGVSGLASSISMLSPNGGNSTLDQNVTIHAEFPNATDHNEIEEAFKTLVNRASQFASRT